MTGRIAPGSARLSTPIAIALLLALAFALRVAWPHSDPAPRLTWSNEVYTDPATMVHAARNKALTGTWVADYNRDYYIFPLMNWLTWIAYEIGGVGRVATGVLSALAGTATLALLAGTLFRCRGRRAALLAAALGAVSYWWTMFARIPIAENVVAALLAGAYACASSRAPRMLALAGAIGVFATLFGKYHAVGALPGLALFVGLRARSLRAVLPLIGGGAVVCAIWMATIFLPHRAEIVGHVARQSTGMHGPLPFAISIADGFGEIYNTLRRSWVFYRMPVESIFGTLFAFWTLGNAKARRERLEDGTALFAFWTVSFWIYLSLLPYKGPRYYVLLAPALIGAAAAQIDRLFDAGAFRFRPPTRLDEHVPILLWLYTLFFGAIDAVKHYVSIVLEWALVPPAKISETFYNRIVAAFSRVDTFNQNLAWAAVLLATAYLVVLWHPEMLRRARGNLTEFSSASLRRLGVFAVGVAVLVGGGQYAMWATHRSTFLDEVKRSLPFLIGPDAVVLGPFAPLLTQDTKLRALPYFGPPGERGLLEKFGITHVFVGGSGDVKEIEARYPELMDRLIRVQSWPLMTMFTSSIDLFRVPSTVDGVTIHDYHPTLFEEGAEAAEGERWAEALEKFGRIREAGGVPVPEIVSLEAICHFKMDDLASARTLLEEAIRLRPKDPLNYQNLGVIDLREAKRADAIRHWLTALRLDPKNTDLEEKLRELAR